MTQLLRILAFAACGVAGYLAGGALTAPPTAMPTAPVTTVKPVEGAKGALVREWEELRARHGSDAGEMAALYAEVKEINDAFRQRAFHSALIAEWAARDPLAALAFLEKKDPDKVGELLREWLRSNARAVIARLLAGDEKSQNALREMLGDLARVAPSLLAEVVSTLPKIKDRFDFTARDAFEVFAKNDPEAARAAAESVSGALRGQALAGVAKIWAEHDGPATVAWAQSLAAGLARDDALRAALIGWAKSDPLAALEHIGIVPPNSGEMYPMPGQRGWYSHSDVGGEVVREAAQRDWDGTIQWLRGHPGNFGEWGLTVLQETISRRLGVDLGGTLDFVASSGIPGLDRALDNALSQAGYAQLDDVWRWLDRQPAGDFTRSLRGSLLWAMAWKEPDTALEYLEKLPDSPDNRKALETGTRGLFANGNGMNRIEDYLAKASPKMRTYLIETALAGIYESIGADARLWVNRINELPADRQGKAIAGLAQSWASADPQAAIQWALSQPDPANRDAALNASAKAWALSDIRDAAAWINAQAVGATRDTATRGLVGGLAHTQPESAWTWALSIQTPAQKIGALQSAYEGLRNKDPALAEQFLQSANLPPADAKTVRQTPPK